MLRGRHPRHPDLGRRAECRGLPARVARPRGRACAPEDAGWVSGSIPLTPRRVSVTLRLVEVGPLEVQGLYSELLGQGLSAGTVVNLHLVLTQALGQAERWGLITRNPVASAQSPRRRRPSDHCRSRDGRGIARGERGHAVPPPGGYCHFDRNASR